MIFNKLASYIREKRRTKEYLNRENPEENYRRFELITNDRELIRAMETVCKKKNIGRKEIALILSTLRIRHGFERKDFGI
mgnify:CR=1 FL=1